MPFPENTAWDVLLKAEAWLRHSPCSPGNVSLVAPTVRPSTGVTTQRAAVWRQGQGTAAGSRGTDSVQWARRGMRSEAISVDTAKK